MRTGFETWATQRDVEDLLQWEQVFGQGFRAIFGFVYWIDPPLVPSRECSIIATVGTSSWASNWQNIAITCGGAVPSGETVCLPSEDFRSLARPLESWL